MMLPVDVVREAYGYRTIGRWIAETWGEPWGCRLPLRAEFTTLHLPYAACVEIRLIVEWPWPRGLWWVVRGSISLRDLAQMTSAVRAVSDSAERLMSALEPEGEPYHTYHPLWGAS